MNTSTKFQESQKAERQTDSTSVAKGNGVESPVDVRMFKDDKPASEMKLRTEKALHNIGEYSSTPIVVATLALAILLITSIVFLRKKSKDILGNTLGIFLVFAVATLFTMGIGGLLLGIYQYLEFDNDFGQGAGSLIQAVWGSAATIAASFVAILLALKAIDLSKVTTKLTETQVRLAIRETPEYTSARQAGQVIESLRTLVEMCHHKLAEISSPFAKAKVNSKAVMTYSDNESLILNTHLREEIFKTPIFSIATELGLSFWQEKNRDLKIKKLNNQLSMLLTERSPLKESYSAHHILNSFKELVELALVDIRSRFGASGEATDSKALIDKFGDYSEMCPKPISEVCYLFVIGESLISREVSKISIPSVAFSLIKASLSNNYSSAFSTNRNSHMHKNREDTWSMDTCALIVAHKKTLLDGVNAEKCVESAVTRVFQQDPLSFAGTGGPIYFHVAIGDLNEDHLDLQLSAARTSVEEKLSFVEHLQIWKLCTVLASIFQRVKTIDALDMSDKDAATTELLKSFTLVLRRNIEHLSNIASLEGLSYVSEIEILMPRFVDKTWLKSNSGTFVSTADQLQKVNSGDALSLGSNGASYRKLVAEALKGDAGTGVKELEALFSFVKALLYTCKRFSIDGLELYSDESIAKQPKLDGELLGMILRAKETIFESVVAHVQDAEDARELIFELAKRPLYERPMHGWAPAGVTPPSRAFNGMDTHILGIVAPNDEMEVPYHPTIDWLISPNFGETGPAQIFIAT